MRYIFIFLLLAYSKTYANEINETYWSTMQCDGYIYHFNTKTKKYKIYFESLNKKDKQNFKAFIGKLHIDNKNGSVEILKPQLRIYNQPNIVTSEADIKTSLFTDKFMTINLVQNQETFNIRYQVKPLMIWIWLSVTIISFGVFLSLIKKKNES